MQQQNPKMIQPQQSAYQMQQMTNAPNQQLPPPPPPPGMAAQWMQRPNPIPGVPIGLEYLTLMDKVLVKQKVDLLEAFVGWEQNNRYVIFNQSGQQIYYAFEETDACMRMCCGAQRRFLIRIVDNLNQEVLRIHREFKCCAGCCWCAGCCTGCAHEVKVETPTGEVLGYVRQKGSFYKPYYDVLDAEHNKLLLIEGPCCICTGPFCPCQAHFELKSVDGSVVCGKITKEYAGFVKEMFSNADTFSAHFPLDLNVKCKATLFGALFLIDFMFFEQKQNNNNF